MRKIKEEETRLLKLVSELEENPFHELFDVPKGTESCFVSGEETDYIADYSFETPMELIRLLTDMWKGEDCQKYLLAAVPCLAAAVFKQEPDAVKESVQEQSGIEVPMFIYNF